MSGTVSLTFFFEYAVMNHVFQHFLSRRFLQFCSVGASGVFVNLGILAALDGLGLHRLMASAIAIECSILSNFAANEFWTFRDRAGQGERLSRMVQFQLVSLVGAGIQFLVFMLCFFGASMLMEGSNVYLVDRGAGGSLFTALMNFISAPPDLGYVMYLAQLLGIAAATGWNFVANLFWTWRDENHA